MAPLTKVRPGDLIRADDWNTLIDHVLELEAAIGKLGDAEPAEPVEPEPEEERPPREPPSQPGRSRLEFLQVIDQDPPTLAYVLLPEESDEVRFEVTLRPTAIAERVEIEVVVDGDVVTRPIGVDRGREVEFLVRATKGIAREGGILGVDLGTERRGVRVSTQPSLTVRVLGGTIDVSHTMTLALPR
jgi:hypothetical protein